jgi:EAL domain-containing protein (putative c-di-GMP-specific phosphodiesterase class I)
VILLSELQESFEAASFQCEHIAQIILYDLEDGLEIADQKIHLSSSIGIVVTDKCNMTAETLLKQADTAMYQAKEMGKNTFRFYTDSIGERITEHYKMGMALRQDLSKGGAFHVVYQPQYNAEKIIIGAEALVRWYSEEYGLVSPMQFIPIAEESGLINEIGLLVVEQVLTDMITMDEIFIKTDLRRISINLSIKQLTNPNLSAHFLDLFKEKEVEPSKVRFEFTESVFLDKALDPKTLFSEMSDIGFTFSLDDFGTGFSSLSYLKELPISELKIDQSFVDGIPHEDSDTTICSATISMAKNLGLELVAEGVETQAQFDWLVAQGCDILQGYLMSKPIEFKAFIKLLNAQT